MNILSYEDIEIVEQELIATELTPHLSLRLPEEAELQNLWTTQKGINKHRQLDNHSGITNKIAMTECLRIQELTDVNATFRMLVYNLLAAVFSPSIESNHINPRSDYNLDLLKTIKCTLYSKDLKPTQIANFRLQATDQQGRCVMAHFFKEMEEFHQKVKDNKVTLRYCEAILERNSHLTTILVSTLRFILKTLEIEGCINYDQAPNLKEAIINIVEYFDLTYRFLEDILLFHEEKIFLSILETKLVLGTYQQSPAKNKYGTELKVKEWPIDSLALSLNGTAELSQTQQLKRKQIVVENDVKLLHCLLESNRSENEVPEKLQHSQNETPHFQESKELYFGRRKKDESQLQMQKDLKKEFAKLILGSSEDTLRNKEEQLRPEEEIIEEDSRSPSNSKKHLQTSQEKGLNFKKAPKVNLNTEHLKEIDAKRSSQGSSSELGSLIHSKNMVCVKTKVDDPSTPQAIKSRKERFGSLGNDFQFVFPEFSSVKNKELQHKENIEPYTGECPCFQQKLKRNILASNTVNVSFTPSFHLKEGKITCQRGSRVGETPKIVVTSPQKYKEYCFRGERVPAFLKTRIERNGVQPTSKERSSKQTPSQRNRTSSKLKQRKQKANQHFKHLSQIILNNRPQDRTLSPKKDESRSKVKKVLKEATSIKKHDYHQIYSRQRFSGSTNYWQAPYSINYDKDPNRNSRKPQYRKTLEQPTLSPNVSSIISPFRTHSPRRYSRDMVVEMNQEERDDLVGFRKLGENRSHPSFNYRPSNYL